MDKIFYDDQIKENKIYGALMKDINVLYQEMDCPDEQTPDMDDTTTGEQLDFYWRADNIGDWAGMENSVALYANDALEQIFRELGAKGNGGIHYYHQTDGWKNFMEKVHELINHYNEFYAFDKLCEISLSEICN